MDDEMRKEALGEVLMGELKAIREYVQDIPLMKQQITNIEDDVEVIKNDMVAVKAMLRLHDEDIKIHEKDIRKIKAQIGIPT